MPLDYRLIENKSNLKPATILHTLSSLNKSIIRKYEMLNINSELIQEEKQSQTYNNFGFLVRFL